MYKQPPGLLKDESGKYIANPDAENMANLPDGYYINLVPGKQEDYIRVQLCGEYGVLREGKPVFPNYRHDLHSVDDLRVVKNEMLFLGHDGGLTPACLIAQIKNGVLIVVKEFVTERMGNSELMGSIVKPWMELNCKDMTHEVFTDPSNIICDSITGENHVIKELNNLGFNCPRPRYKNDIEPRIEAVNWYLNKLVGGYPAIQISRSGCPTLCESLQERYVYRQMKIIDKDHKHYRDVPDKTHPWSDVVDALQYICVGLTGSWRQKEEPKKDDSIANSIASKISQLNRASRSYGRD